MELAALVFFFAVLALFWIRFWSKRVLADQRFPGEASLPLGHGGWASRTADVRLQMQVGVSIIILVAALLLIFLRDDAEEQKWAFGTVGLILGFWLK